MLLLLVAVEDELVLLLWLLSVDLGEQMFLLA